MSFSHPAQQALAPTTRRLRQVMVVYAVVPVLLLLGLCAYALHASQRQYQQRAEMLTQNLAAALERSVAANIEKIDLALGSIVDHLEAQLARGPLDLAATSAHIRSQVARRPELDGIRVTDATGLGIAGPGLEGRRPISFAEREWFTVQRDRADAGLHMSRPLVSKITGEWIISFSRRYRTPDGSFAGGVSAAVPLSYLSRELLAIDVGPRGAVVLRDASLRMIARHPVLPPGADNEVGSQKVSSELRDRVAAGQHQGTLLTRQTPDGIERTLSFYQLRAAPLVVMVALAAEDYLADWYSEVRVALGVCALLLGLFATGLVLQSRMLAQNRLARRRIDLLATAFQHSGESLVITDARNNIIEVNPGFVQQTGYAAHDVVGRNPRLMSSGRTTRAEYEAMWHAVKTTGRWRGELWNRSKDGREYPAWLSIAVVRDENGDVLHHIASAIDMTEAKQAEDRILHLAHHDTLTQLPNRVFLLGRLEQAMAAARRDGTELAMLFIDMDRFKDINDSLGHHVGDGMLVEVGRRLRALVRESDIVARLGGDEFVVVLSGINGPTARTAATVAAKVITILGEPYQVEGHDLHSTPSIGIGIFPGDGENPDTLMKNADTAMYHAKSVGRNNFQFFTAQMNATATARLALEAGLRTAIERQELFVHYQPQVDLPSGRVVCVEALLRWRHPELGLVPPLTFIPVAEDTGQIEAIGAWVLEQAAAQVARWRGAGHPTLRVAVNLSAQQLRTEGFVALVARTLLRHGLSGAALELEITESMAMRDPARTAQMLQHLRDHGVAVAIDDFGTGHSSLAYLKQLPLSCLKLDRSFVMDIEHDANDAAICTATIQMAHSLGLGVVAEGVETAAQLEFLRRLGCDLVQGYYYSRPMAADDCTAYLAAERMTVAA